MCLAGPAGGKRQGHRWGLGAAVVADLAQARVSRLRHVALLYASPGEFAVGVARFAEAAAEAGDPVLVACAAPSLNLLRSRLNGHGGLVTWADMRGIGLNPARLIDRIHLFAGQHRGRLIWCVHEPAWLARTPAELGEVIRHEALVNLALGGYAGESAVPLRRTARDRADRQCGTYPSGADPGRTALAQLHLRSRHGSRRVRPAAEHSTLLCGDTAIPRRSGWRPSLRG